MNILLIGDSLIEYGDWRSLLPEHQIRNFGIAGETVQGLQQRISRTIRAAAIPDLVIFMTGTNNIAMQDFGFVPIYGEVVDSFLAVRPQTELIVTSLLPIAVPWLADSAVPKMNEKIQTLCRTRGIRYLDLFNRFLLPNGGSDPSLFTADGIHLSDRGYSVWADSLSDMLDQLR